MRAVCSEWSGHCEWPAVQVKGCLRDARNQLALLSGSGRGNCFHPLISESGRFGWWRLPARGREVHRRVESTLWRFA